MNRPSVDDVVARLEEQGLLDDLVKHTSLAIGSARTVRAGVRLAITRAVEEAHEAYVLQPLCAGVVPPAATCGTCKHLWRKGSGILHARTAWPDKAGVCRRSDSRAAVGLQLRAIPTASGRIWVAEDFGCVQWERGDDWLTKVDPGFEGER